MRSRFLPKCAIIQILLHVTYNMCKAVPEEVVEEALLEGSVKMPCEVLQKKDDTVEFVFWYKNDGVTALYTLDAREGRGLNDAVHMKNETYADRVHFHVEGKDPFLQMDELREEDTGAYYCRVDYQWSATEIKRVDLVVVVPPKRLVIKDDSGQEIRDIAGPYKERSDIFLTCEALKGYPPPNVTWWRDGKLWDNTFKKGSNSVVNEIKLKNLSRSELMATFQCKAQNTKLTPPVVKKIVLDLYLYPTTVQIVGRPSALSAGRHVDFTCQTSGSRPPAKISWWLNGTQLTDHLAEIRDNGTISRLRLTPKVQHNRCVLACRSENSKLHDGIIEDARILNITCGRTSGIPAPDQGGGAPSTQRGRLHQVGLRCGLEPSLPEGGLALQRPASVPQRIGHRRGKWKHLGLQKAHKKKPGDLQVLRHKRRRTGNKPGTDAEHQPCSGVQRKPANHLRSGTERERSSEVRSRGVTNGRDVQVGVQQHGAQALRPPAHEQRHRQQRHLQADHPIRLRDAVLLGKQQHRTPADVLFLHSNSASLQARESKCKRVQFVKRRK